MAHQYDNAGQQRILHLILALSGHELHGLAPKDLAEHLKVSPGTITRDIHNLSSCGFAEQIQETGRIRLSAKMVQIAVGHANAMSRAADRLNEIKQRYSREP